MMQAKYLEINLGTEICKKIKNIYFFEQDWPTCWQEVSNKFTDLKQIARKFYTDKDDLAILQELRNYNAADIEDMFHMNH